MLISISTVLSAYLICFWEDGVSCGGQNRISNCSMCPKTDAIGWCNDDCYLDVKDETCKKKGNVDFN